MEGAMREREGVAGRVDGGRLWRRLMEMAEIGAIPGNGVNRQALSEEDIAARELLIDWARRRGYAVAVDDAANLFIRRSGSEPDLPPVVTEATWTASARRAFDGIRVMPGWKRSSEEDTRGPTRRPVELVLTNGKGALRPRAWARWCSRAGPLVGFERRRRERDFVRPGAHQDAGRPGLPPAPRARRPGPAAPMSRPISSKGR